MQQCGKYTLKYVPKFKMTKLFYFETKWGLQNGVIRIGIECYVLVYSIRIWEY